jgi:hypothetical protein
MPTKKTIRTFVTENACLIVISFEGAISSHEVFTIFFCSTLSEFENFLLCQANFEDFKRFGAFKGLVEQKKTLYSTHSCVNWTLYGTCGPLKRE